MLSQKLQSVVDVIVGTARAPQKQSEDGPIFVSSKDLGSDRRELRRIAFEDLPRNLVRLLEGDVVVTLFASDARPEVVSGELVGAVLGQDCVALRSFDPNVVTPEWLSLWVKSSDFKQQVQSAARGAAIKRVPATALRQFELPVPEPESQHRAVAISSDLASLRDDVRRLEQLLNELASIELELIMRGAA